MNKLTALFLETGLLQFGWFEPGGMPFRLNLDMLPAYPDVLKQIIAAAKPHTANMSRLVTTVDSLPFGVGLSLETGIPLVYSRGSGEAPSHDLVGAYDIGHPTLLLMNALDGTQNLQKFVANARSVGLQIHHLLTILRVGEAPTFGDITVQSLLNLHDLVKSLVDAGRLPAGHRQAVLDWVSRQPST